MPRLDGTGPAGLGPMTGGQRGWCNPYSPLRMGYAVPGIFQGFGRGWFCRRFFLGGRGWRNWFYATGLPGWVRAMFGYPAFGMGYISGFTPEMTPQAEIEILKEQQDFLKEQLDKINKRISELEKKE